MSKHVVVIGGGIIGLSTAYYCHKEGHQVTVIDKSDFSSGASYVNGGIITPSHIIPLSAPGMITKGVKWMLNSESPFHVKPRLDTDFFKWFWAFKKSATKAKVATSIRPILNINLLSHKLYEELKQSSDLDFHYNHKGLLMAYKTEKAGEEEWEIGKRAIELGLKVENLSPQEVAELEPKVNLDVKGGVYFHSDAHMTPNDFMGDLLIYLESHGVTIKSNEEVKDLKISGTSISEVITNKENYKADEFVLAAGSWSSLLIKKIGLNIPIQAGKGYSLNVSRKTHVSIPTILCEKKVAVTPMDGFTRFGGMMEIGGVNHKINTVRVKAIAKAVKSYYPTIEIDDDEIRQVQCGLRPLTPDGLPYIGKLSKWKNITIATGHAMMGWSLGPATGKLVSEIVSNKKTSVDLSPFNPERKF